MELHRFFRYAIEKMCKEKKSLNHFNLKKISIGIPAKEILKKFNNIVIPIFQSIEKNKDENKNLAQLRDTLLPKLMSGELKLSEIKTKLYE